MEPVVAAAEEGERHTEESEVNKHDKVEARGKLQEEVLADEIQGAGNEEVNGDQNAEAKEFGNSQDRDQAIEGAEDSRSDEVIEEAEKIEGPVDKSESIEGEEGRSDEVIEEAEKIEGPEDKNKSRAGEHRATDDGIDEFKEESNVKDGDDKVEEAEIEEQGKAVKQSEVIETKEAEVPSKEVKGGVIRQELGEAEDLKSAPSKEVVGGVIRHELESELGEVEDVKSAPTVDSAVLGDEIEEDAPEAAAKPEKGSRQSENVVKESDRSGLLEHALRFLPNVQNLDSWASGVAFGIVTTCSIVVLWEKYYSSRRKV